MSAINNDLVVRQIIDFVAMHALCRPEELTEETRIGEDLRIVGDDADELLSDFSRKFDVDISGIDFNNYFPSEATSDMHYYLIAIAKNKSHNLIINAIRSFEAKFWKIFAKKTDYKTLTIGALANFVRG